MELHERVHRGNQASEILNNELFNEIADGFEAKFIEAIKNTATHEIDKREELFAYYRVAKSFKEQFISTLEDAKLAVKEIEHKSAIERAKEWIRDF